MFRSLGRLTYHRRWWVVGAWLAIIAIGVASSGPLGNRVTAEFAGSDRLESARVLERVQSESATGGDIVIVIDGLPTVGMGLAPAVIDQLDRIGDVDGVVAVTDPWRSEAPDLVATDGTAALAVVSFTSGLDAKDEATLSDEVVELAHQLVDDGHAAEVIVGGEPIVLQEFEEQAEEDLRRGEAIALPIALVAMVLIFGGLRAAGMPLAVAAAGFLTSMISLLGATFVLDEVSVFAINVVSMLGIGLGIDYGLLLVSRFREERGRGRSLADAVETTVGTAGVTVLFSALTVAVAMSGMFVFQEPTMTSFGIGGLSAVIFSMIAAVTLLPALLSIFGSKIKPAAIRDETDGLFFRLSSRVQRFALPVVLLVSIGLAVLALPFLGARLENGDARSLPRSSEARAAALTMAERFPARGAEPVVVFADADADSIEWQRFERAVGARDDVAGVSVRPGFDESVVVLDVVPTGTSQDAVAQNLVTELRQVPADFAFEVGGIAANTLDTNQMISQRAPYAVGIVVVATFVLLFLMTGSIAIPIKAVIMNMLSLGASFGALVWIFQDGNLAGPLGFDPVGSVDLWMPIIIFLFAFGLSMDYEVFLLSRVKEIHDRTGDNDLAVSLGLQRTGRIITSAAALIVVVFAGFAAGEVLTIKQLGIGLALAVVVDATIVRTLLVPATMRLLGEWNWWAPAPLRRFHDRFGLHEPVDVDGSDLAGPGDGSMPDDRQPALV